MNLLPRSPFFAMAAIAHGLVASSACVGGVITNGSFENYTLSESAWDGPGVFDNFSSPSTSLVGWELVAGEFTYNRGLWNSTDGASSIDLGSAASATLGVIQQQFSTTIGSQYLLKFDVGIDPALSGPAGGPIKQVRVDIGSLSQTYTVDRTGFSRPNVPWRTESILFTASSSTSTLRFTALTPGAANITLDSISVTDNTAVPEPTSLAIFGFGALGLVAGGMRRRRRK